MLNKYSKTQSGQTLLEITISLGIALAVVTGLIITTVNGLKNSQFSKNQSQATKYSQEGIDIVRTIKDRNYPVLLPSGWTTWKSMPTGTNYSFNLAYNTSCTPNQPYCLVFALPTAPESVSGTILKRQILIEDDSPTQRRVTSTVSWTDSSGSHESKLVTVLGN